MAWEKIPETTKTKVGSTYRVGMQIKAPYSDFLAGTIKNAIKAGVALRNLNPFDEFRNLVTVNSVYVVPPTVASHDVVTGRSPLWWVYVEFTKKANSTAPVVQEASAADLALIGGLIALIITAATAVLIAGKSFERLVVKTLTDPDTGLLPGVSKVLNPGVVLAAFVLGFLYLSHR